MLKNMFLTAEAAATRQALDGLIRDLSILRGELYLLQKFRQDQARAPAGEPDGGQWVDEGRGDEDEESEINDPPIRPVYPVEMVLGAVFGGLQAYEALAAVRVESFPQKIMILLS